MILLVATGGTISGRVGSEGTYGASASAADLLSRIEPALAASVSPVDFGRKLSFEITLDEWLDLAVKIHGWNEDPGIAAILVVQGTALLEEVPFLVSLFAQAQKPVVFTGAMVPGDRPDSDAVGNLVDALAVCRDPQSTAYGPLVVMGGLAITAETVRKAHRQSRNSITSTDAPVAEVSGGLIRWRLPPILRTKRFETVALARNVPLLKVVLGIERELVEAILSTTPGGLVVEGFPGGGGLPVDIAAILKREVTRIPIVLGSRAPEGRIGDTAGGRSGSGVLLRAGLISSGPLMSEKARLLLMAAIANAPAGPDAVGWVRAAFSDYLDVSDRA